MLHAGVADRSMWREHLDWLADAGHRAIAVDLPGFGDAEIGPGLQAPWDDVLTTLQELGVPGALLVGNSYGAAVALRIAARAPAAASALMLVSPPPLRAEPSPVLRAAWEAEESALQRGDLDGAVAAVLDAWLQPGAPEALRERVASMQRRAFERQAAAPEGQEAPDPLEQQPQALQRLRIPVLAASGETDMPDFIAGAEQIAELVPQAEVVTVAGAGHLAPLEAPEEFRAILLGFLDRLHR